MDQFLEDYFKLLSKEFADWVEKDRFIKALMKSTESMIRNNGEKTNEEVFMDSFFRLLDIQNKERYIEKIDDFYNNKFGSLGNNTKKNNNAIKVVQILKENNYQLALATNPLFPKKAIVERLRWTGLDPKDFSLITSYELMHYSKSNLNYYQEILKKLNAKAEECIMVGNDMQEDMVASKLGIKTILIEDLLINREEREDISVDWKCSFEDFKRLVIKNFSE